MKSAIGIHSHTGQAMTREDHQEVSDQLCVPPPTPPPPPSAVT